MPRSRNVPNTYADDTLADRTVGAVATSGEAGGTVRALTATRLYISEQRLRYKRETVQKRCYHLERFVMDVGDVDVARIKRQHIEEWLFSMEVSPATLRTRFSTVKSFFEFCRRRGWIRDLPTDDVVLPRVPKRQPRALSLEQLQALGAVLPDERARLIVALAVNEGLRRVEISRVELGDIDFNEMTLRVVTAKANTEDLLPLSQSTHDGFLLPYLAVRGRRPGALIQSEYGGGLTPDRIGALVVQWMKDAGIKKEAFDGTSLHACRHTFAMNLLGQGADPTVIQAGLRHSTLASTWTYLRGQRDVERLRPFMDRLAS